MMILAEDDDFHESKNGHETDLEMSPRPLGTTVFEEIYIRIQF